MELFRGYLLSNGKIPLTSVNTGAILSEPPKIGDYVGVLRDDIVQLDFDDEATTEIAMKVVTDKKLRCDVLRTTRGVHLYFLTDGTFKSQNVGIYNAMGLSCDIGLGSKNRVVPLRTTKQQETKRIVNGVEEVSSTSVTTTRPWVQTYTEIEVCPPYFRPITKTAQNFDKVDGRNQTLFDYILKLQFHSYNRDEVRKTIKVINEYMLYEPLSAREIDTITRDEAFSEEIFYEGKRFLHHRFGDYMLANSNVMIIDGQPHIYTDEQLYSNNPDDFEKQMLGKIASLKDTQRKEVYKYIALKCTKRGEFAHPKYIGMKSGILDIQTMKMHDYSPAFVINNRIPYDYDPNATSDLFDKTLNKVACQDAQIRLLVEEMIGYTLFRKNSMQSCFILTGEGSNGKSTILNAVKKLIGKGNYSSLDLRELEDQFKPSEMHNKLANIGDDISAKYLEGSSVFKKVVTGESFMVQRKFGHPFELESYATQIFCANELPAVHDKSDGFNRRIIIVPFNAKFTVHDTDYDPFIEDKLLSDEGMAFLLRIAIEGLGRVLYSKAFTKSDRGDAEMKSFVKSNNNVLEWLDYDPNVENEAIGEVYLQYSVWCNLNGCMPVKQPNLSREIKKHMKLATAPRRVDGKSVRVYVKGE